uniref:SWIM-type domain-containing protein n=2 Tax=Phytophthora ramorum TaxID=164328 RepID=H3H6J2_PHYRM
MTMNEFGEGAVVQQSLLEANGDWHMERAVAHFKRLHPTRIDRLRVIVVDKDLNEIKVLESNFPRARVLICHFHVIKYLKEKRAKPEFCKISADDASQVDAAVHAMVYSDSAAKYKISHDSFHGICDRVGLQDFFAYFEKNWDASQERWVLYHRAKLPHFRNHTNNWLENFFGKLKDAVDGSSSMAGALASAGRYKFAVSGGEEGQVVVQGPRKTHRLRVDTWECDCEFGMTMMLPCRHAIAYRKKEKIPGPLIPWMRIDSRWTNTTSDLKRVKQFSYETFSTDSKLAREIEKRTHAQRYREAVRATHLICSELADIDDEDEFEDIMEFVLNQWRNVRQRKMSGVSRAVITRGSKTRAGGTQRATDEDVKLEFGLNSSDSDDLPDDKDDYEENERLQGAQDHRVAAGRSAAQTQEIHGSWREGRQEVIETFVRIQNLRKDVQLGLDMHKWLTVQGIPALPAEYHDIGNKVAAEILESYPHKLIEGLPNTADFAFSLLYRATPPTWLTDAAIRALCLRLAADFPSCRFAGFQAAVPAKNRTRSSSGRSVDRTIRDRVIQQVEESGVEAVLLPLNFQNAHWCCVVVSVDARRIFYYDPLNQAPYLKSAMAIATQLKIAGLQEYDIIAQNNPIQFDAFSCGVYVCWMFIRHVAKGPPLDMSLAVLPRRRFELFYYLLSGRLLPKEDVVHHDAEEEKTHAPLAGGNDHDDENLPPTQVAK